MTASIIQKRLAKWLDYMTNTCVPNCHVTGFEADFLCMMASGYLDEYEIKISLADLRREFNGSVWIKSQKHRRLSVGDQHPKAPPIRKFFLCLPEDLNLTPGVLVLIPDYCGIVRIPTDGRKHPYITQSPKMLVGHRKLTSEERWKVLRLGYIRYWNFHSEIGATNES